MKLTPSRSHALILPELRQKNTWYVFLPNIDTHSHKIKETPFGYSCNCGLSSKCIHVDTLVKYFNNGRM
jgi:hypothetical protein